MTHEADKGGANHIQTFVLVMLSEPREEEKTEIQKSRNFSMSWSLIKVKQDIWEQQNDPLLLPGH